MNYLITGGAGYVGIELAYSLATLRSTKKILIYDSMRRSNFNVFGGLRKIRAGLVDFIESDILDNQSLQDAVNRSDVIFHLAAEVPDQFTDQNAYVFDQINNWGSSLLVQCVENSSSVKKVVYLSSLQVFGGGEVSLLTTNPNPTTFYGLSKLKAERHFLRLAEENYHAVSIVRCPIVYGYSKNLRLGTGINKLIFDAHFKGRVSIHGVSEYQAPHIYIDNLIAVLLGFAESEKPGIGYAPVQNVSLDELISGLTTVFENIEVIYLEQDQPDNTLIVKPDHNYSELRDPDYGSLVDNIRKFCTWFIY